MEQAIPAQPPAVVLRSRYELVRALLGIAIAAVVALSVAGRPESAPWPER